MIFTNKLVNTPEPAGITLPSNEKPNTILASPTATLNPASAAAPPDALNTSGPFIVNWNPPISRGVSYKISKVVSVAAPNEISAVRQKVPSPKHTPHSS